MPKEKQNETVNYDSVFEVLKNLPLEKEKNTESVRWRWFRRLDEFEDILEAVNPRYSMYKNRIKNGKQAAIARDMDIAAYTNRHDGNLFDPLLFLESVMEAVNRFTGVNRNGETYTFAQSVNWRYRKKLDQAAKDAKSESELVSMSLDGKAEISDSAVAEGLFGVISNENDAFEDVMADVPWGNFFRDEIYKKSSINDRLIRALLSRDILIGMKLYELPKGLRRVYEAEMEPDCTKWCPKHGECKVNGYPKKCYVRYGRITNIECAGNPDVYEVLKQCESEVFAFLDNEYVWYAFPKRPICLYDIYANRLRDFAQEEGHTFRFSNEVMAKALEVSPSTVSRGAARYENEVREKLRKMFLKKYV